MMTVQSISSNSMLVLYFPQGNDITVNVYYPGISDGTGSSSEFYYKTDRETSDADVTTKKYTAPIVANPDSPGECMSTFKIPSADNGVAGALWWRIDTVDAFADRSTVGYGTLLVEAV
jgi:hypothetical protein